MAEESSKEHIRTYTFHGAGYIPGVPGIWPAVDQVTIDEETNAVISVDPPLPSAVVIEPAEPVETGIEAEAVPTQQEETVQETPPETVPVETVQETSTEGQGEALPVEGNISLHVEGSISLQDAVAQLGGEG